MSTAKDKKNVFEIMQTVISTTRAPQEEIDSIPEFIFRRWLSNNQNTLQMVNFFNIHKIPISSQYDTVQGIFGGKIKFIKYPKNLKDESNNLDLVSKYYNVSKEKAKEYLLFLSAEDLKNISEFNDSLKPRKGN